MGVRAWVGALVSAAALTAPGAAMAQEQYEVGAAARSINPTAEELATNEVFLGGYGVSALGGRSATGILGEGASVRAFAVRAGEGEAFAIADMEVQGWFVATRDGPYGIVDMRREVERRTDGGLRAEQVVIQSDHSHSGLDTMGVWGGVPLSVRQRVFRRTVEAIVEAFEERRAGTLHYGARAAPQLLNNQFATDPNNQAMDTDVRVLQARDAAGDAFATLLNFSAHTTVLGAANRGVSGDWVQRVNPMLEDRFGGVAVTAVGTLGRSQPNRNGGPLCGPDGTESGALCRLDAYADLVADEAEALVADPAAFTEIEGDPVVAARTYLVQDPSTNAALLGLLGVGAVAGAPLNRSLLPPWQTGNVVGTVAGVARIGDVLLASMPGEAYPQIPQRLRDVVGGDIRAGGVMTAGLANDQLGYLIAPFPEAFAQPICRTALSDCGDFDETRPEPISNDNYFFNVSNTMGERVTCALLRGAGGVLRDDEDHYESQEPKCLLTATDRAFPHGSDTFAPADATDGDPLGQHDYTGGEEDGPVKAGVAVVDASWRVGSTAGQYADVRDPSEAESDPHQFSTFKQRSDGTQSRLDVRALVTEDASGERIALVKNDLYLAQDLLVRRTAQILAERDETDPTPTNITQESLTVAVTHNHSSPYHSSSGPGAWTFQDVYDGRFFEEYATKMADAVQQAADGMKRVRIGAAVGALDEPHRHSFGPAIADDGTPAGYPDDDAEHDMIVVRYDDIETDPANPKPLALMLNWSLHPEMLDGNGLISGDYVAPMQRMLDRETGATTIFTQSAVGTAEPERSSYHSIHERLEFTHKEYAASEYAARLVADAAADTWRRVATPAATVPFDDTMQVGMVDRWYPGPASHPYPGVSNCRTEAAIAGEPGIPVVGLPVCQRPTDSRQLQPLREAFGLPEDPRDLIPELPGGFSPEVPIPSNYSAPSYAALQESFDIHLQAMRLGDILVTVCSCEQWKDQSRNIRSRTNTAQGDQYLGYDWSTRYTRTGPDEWTGPDPRDESKTLKITDAQLRRMRAQVRNDARGWDFLENAPTAESEPRDPDKIKGNYTHEELPPDLGYALTVPIAMANDYNGYIATYREYQRGDHYRKALTAWGPHSSDYMATRLVQLGGHLKQRDEPVLPTEPQRELADSTGRAKVEADLAANDAKATKLGTDARAEVAAYEANPATLPDDGGTPGPAPGGQPKDIERFDAAHFTWVGGSNYISNPLVRVERQRADGTWEPFADGSGEVPLRVEYPTQAEQLEYRAGQFQWRWTASFEAFVSGVFDRDAEGADPTFDPGERPVATPAGTYRFVVDGKRRSGRATQDYRVTSAPFAVRPWSGITAEDMRLGDDGTVSFRVGPRSERVVPAGQGQNATPQSPELRVEIGEVDYPNTYGASPFGFVDPAVTAYRDPAARGDASQVEFFCFECSFRPWIDAGRASEAAVTVTRADGSTETVGAARRADGRWAMARPLAAGESAVVAPGGVRDRFGNRNGAASAVVQRPAGSSAPKPDPGDDGQAGGRPEQPGQPGPPAQGGPAPGQRPAPGSGPGSGGGCRDRLAPRSRFLHGRLKVTRRGAVLAGRSADRGCGRVTRVFVAIARESTRRTCRFLDRRGKLGARRSCLRTTYLRARGRTRWTFRLAARLPRGSYKVWVRGVDSAGNVERKARSRNFVRLRVR